MPSLLPAAFASAARTGESTPAITTLDRQHLETSTTLEPDEILVVERHFPADYQAKPMCRPYFELRYVQSGEGVLHLDLLKIRFKAGDIMLVPPRINSWIEVNVNNPPKLYQLSFEPRVINELQNNPTIWQTTRVFPHSAFGPEFASTLRDCLYEKSLGRPGWRRYIHGRGQLLIVNFFRLVLLRGRAVEDHVSRADLAHVRVQEYIRRLDTEFYRIESLNSVSENLGMSARHFSQIFRETTGMTWLKYVRTLRIRHAKKLLESTLHPVLSIAFQSGFEEATTFYRVFKFEVGMTPGEWRERIRSNLK